MPVFDGGPGNDTLIGGPGDDTLRGFAGSDILDGAGGSDRMEGGAGNDVYYVDTAVDHVVEDPNAGFDTVYASTSFTLAAGQEVELLATANSDGSLQIDLTGNELNNIIIGNAASNQLVGGAGDDQLDGRAGNDLLQGGIGNDILNGDVGDDRMEGGVGDDVYYVDSAADIVIESIGAGRDFVYASTSFSLAVGQEVELVATINAAGTESINFIGNEFNNILIGNDGANTLVGGGGNDELRGNAGADLLYGDEGNDILDGGAGDDVLIGGVGNDRLISEAGNDALYGGIGDDTYVVNAAGAYIVEYAGEGVDSVLSSVSYVLSGWYIEALTLTGSAAINGTGNQLNNVILGNDAANVLHGGSGTDYLSGGGGNDTLIAEGNDDQLYGGTGNDTYVVDTAGAYIVELFGEGTDTVVSSVSYVLSGWEIENLTLTGNAAINGTGNQLDNVIFGNGNDNVLRGGAGADTLIGGLGDDTLFGDDGNDLLYGDEGNDILDGGLGDDVLIGGVGNDRLISEAGIDALYGGIGDDTYVVNAAGAYIVEYVGEGMDSVLSSVSYVLSGWYIEALTLTGSAAINGTGNQLDNVIIGNDAANVLHGGSGADYLSGGGGDDRLIGDGADDQLYGGTGNDTYVVDNAGAYIVEFANEGIDTVESSVSYVLSGHEIENLTLTGGSAINGTGNHLDNVITGNDAANILIGGAGDDRLIGGGGGDRLAGGTGADDFVFSSALGGGNVDHITDFQSGADRIVLYGGTGQSFAALPPGTLAAPSFVAGSAAADADDFIIYNSQTGEIFYDADGNGAGAAVLFATLQPGTMLGAGDFFVV